MSATTDSLIRRLERLARQLETQRWNYTFIDPVYEAIDELRTDAPPIAPPPPGLENLVERF